MAKKKKKKGHFGLVWGGKENSTEGISTTTKAQWAKEEAKRTVTTRKASPGMPEKKEEAKFYLRGRGGKKRVPLKGSEKAQREAIRKHGKDPDPDEVWAAGWAGVDIRKKKRKPRKPRKKVTRR